MAEAPKLLTAVEAGRILRKGPYWVTEQCRAGNLRASKVGGTWLITVADIEAHIAENTNRPAPEPTPRRRKTRRT